MAKIHTLKISNYRSIQNFEQNFGLSDFVCIIGRGDSGKTAILEAISLVLSPRWNLSFYDMDFYNGDISKSIEIEASLYDLPEELIQESKYGLHIRGLDKENNILHDDIKSNHEAVLTIKLIVEKDLEPRWFVVNNRDLQESIEMRTSDRAKLNMFFVSDYIDKHFSWNKGNPLYSLLKQNGDDFENNNIIIDAFREAKEKIDSNTFKQLDTVIEKIKSKSSILGVDIPNTHTTIDSRDIFTKDGKICLHEDKIPFRQKGKGSKRLISIAIQTELAESGGIVLIDEIEQGLEPDRVRHLTSKLKRQKQGQVFITTHSRDVIVELQAENLFLMKGKKKELINFGESFQGCLRNNPEAFFSKRVLICEGATEVGICRAINNYRVKQGNPNYAVLGVGIVDGGGSGFVDYCKKFKQAGFHVCTFCDSDDSGINKQKESLKLCGIEIVDCDAGNAIEQQLFNDLPWNSVQKLIDYAIDEKGIASIQDLIKNQHSNTLPENWHENDTPEMRVALGKASSKGWYKRIDHGEVIGKILCEARLEIADKTLGKQFEKLFKWINNA